MIAEKREGLETLIHAFTKALLLFVCCPAIVLIPYTEKGVIILSACHVCPVHFSLHAFDFDREEK